MPILKGFINAIDAINYQVGKILSYLLFAFFFLLFVEVILRYFFNSPTVWANELAQMLFGAYAILGGGYILLTGGHVNVDVILIKLSPKIQIIINIIILLALILFFVIMGHQIGEEAYISWIDKEYRAGTTLLIPTWPPKFIAFLGSYVLVLSFLVQLSRIITDMMKKGTSGGGR